MKLFTAMLLVLTALPCFAEETAINKAVAKRVYEEGLSRGIFTVPYTDDFVGHGGSTTFTHEDGLKEAKGWRSAFPDLTVNQRTLRAGRACPETRVSPDFAVT